MQFENERTGFVETGRDTNVRHGGRVEVETVSEASFVIRRTRRRYRVMPSGETAFVVESYEDRGLQTRSVVGKGRLADLNLIADDDCYPSSWCEDGFRSAMTEEEMERRMVLEYGIPEAEGDDLSRETFRMDE